MVGVPRSSGCRVCVERRIKCDEGLPQCNNCIRYGKLCPGYDKGFKFVVGRPHREKRKKKLKEATNVRQEFICTSQLLTKVLPGDLESVDSDVSSSRNSVYERSGSSEFADEDIRPSEGAKLLAQIFSQLPTAVDPRKQYQFQLINSLCDSIPKANRRNEILMITSYLTQLPEHLGKSKALDSATIAFATQQIGTVFGDQDMIRTGHNAYIRALSHLQTALSDSNESLRSGTHAAAYLLCTYELFAGTTGFTSWMKHAEGLAKLVRYRRASRYQSNFDIAVLRSCRGLIIMDCMFKGREVFLTRPEWRRAMRDRKPDHMSDGFHQFFETFMELMAELPPLLGKGWTMREAVAKNAQIPYGDDEILDLILRTTDLYTRFQLWAADLPVYCSAPTEQPSTHNDPVFPIVYSFGSYTAGGIYVNYWACLIILQMILHTCGCLPEFVSSSAELAISICKSVEWNAHGIWGGFRLGFTLRIAFEVATPDVKRWIGEWHLRLSKHYAATSVQGLPEHPVKDELMRRLAMAP